MADTQGQQMFKITIDAAQPAQYKINAALDRYEELASIESRQNPPAAGAKTALESLQWASIIIKNLEAQKLWPELYGAGDGQSAHSVQATNDVAIGKVLADIFTLVLIDSCKVINLYFEAQRVELLESIFGSSLSERVNTFHESAVNYSRAVIKGMCAQVIFDTADLNSAIDALIMNLSDSENRGFQWLVNSVFVQESLRDRLMQLITNDRLDNLEITRQETDADRGKSKHERIEQLATVESRFGSHIRRNADATLSFVMDVQQRELDTIYQPTEMRPVSVCFFRDAADVFGMLADITVQQAPSGVSVWTENINRLYTFVGEVSSDFVWGNLIPTGNDYVVGQLSLDVPSYRVDRIRGWIANHYIADGRMRHLYIAFP